MRNGIPSSTASAALGRQQQFAEVEEQQKVPTPGPEVSSEPRVLPNLSLGADEPLQHHSPMEGPEVPAGSAQECAALLIPAFPRTPGTPLPAGAAGLKMTQGREA